MIWFPSPCFALAGLALALCTAPTFVAGSSSITPLAREVSGSNSAAKVLVRVVTASAASRTFRIDWNERATASGLPDRHGGGQFRERGHAAFDMGRPLGNRRGSEPESMRMAVKGKLGNRPIGRNEIIGVGLDFAAREPTAARIHHLRHNKAGWLCGQDLWSGIGLFVSTDPLLFGQVITSNELAGLNPRAFTTPDSRHALRVALRYLPSDRSITFGTVTHFDGTAVEDVRLRSASRVAPHATVAGAEGREFVDYLIDRHTDRLRGAIVRETFHGPGNHGRIIRATSRLKIRFSQFGRDWRISLPRVECP